MKKATVFISIILITLSVFTFGTFIVLAETEYVTGQEITLEIDGSSRTGVYTGTLQNGLPNGMGKFESQNSDGVAWYYEGEFADGRFNGEGKAVWDGTGRQEGVWVNGELYNGKYYTNSGALKYEYINGERATAKSFNIYIILLIGIPVICLIVLFWLPFRIFFSRIASPKLLYSPKLVAKEKPDLIDKTVAVTDIFKGILCLYRDRIEFISEKSESVFMFSEIFAVRHQHKNIMAVILYSGEKHGIIVKPEDKKDEWIDMINNQMKWHRESSPEDPNSAESLHKKSIINIYPTAAYGGKNGTLFLYKDRIKFAVIKIRPANPFTRNHLDKIEYDSNMAPMIIPLSQINHVQHTSKGVGDVKLDYLQIETHMNEKYDIFMAPRAVIQEWVDLIHKAREYRH